MPVYPCKLNFVIPFDYSLVCNPNERNTDSYNTIMTTTAMNDITVYISNVIVSIILV
jgi:hypothetical protein